MLPLTLVVEVVKLCTDNIGAKDSLDLTIPRVKNLRIKDFICLDLHTATRDEGTYITTMKLRALSIFESRWFWRAMSFRVAFSCWLSDVIR